MIARFTILFALVTLSSIAVGQEQTPPADSTSLPPTNVSSAAPDQTEADPTSVDSTNTAPQASVESVPSGDEAPLSQAAEALAQEAKLKELLSLVQDNTKFTHRREIPAYFMLVKKALDRTPEQLRNEVTLNPRFNDLYRKPSDYRGQLVTVKLNARRVLPADYTTRNVAGVKRLYEIWGWTQEAKAWMYCCIVPELPEGFPEEGDIQEQIELTGYFFKMQAYQPGLAAPNARDLVAPMVIGRIVRAEPMATKTANTMGNWPMILIIGFGTIVMFRLMLHLRGMGRTAPIRRNYRRRSLEPIDPDLVDDALNVPNRGIRIRNANEA